MSEKEAHVGTQLPQATAVDPVCGMTVQIPDATAKGLRSRHEEHDYVFCGRGCKLDFDEDPTKYLDPGYVASM